MAFDEEFVEIVVVNASGKVMERPLTKKVVFLPSGWIEVTKYESCKVSNAQRRKHSDAATFVRNMEMARWMIGGRGWSVEVKP